MATQAQLDEKRRQDIEGSSSSNIQGIATAAQLAEKSQRDQASSSNLTGFATPAQLEQKARRNGPPPLPPRIDYAPAPPPYSSDDAKRSELISEQWRSKDPRSSSTHSLVPSESRRDGRRTLLLIYIHGFMGNETSFQSFPAHVHNLLTITLAETHVVHTKIYPRYKSRKAIDFARDDFGSWLEVHENHYTDIVLLGHSMGGILSAEVALQLPVSPATGEPFQHKILGTISFDTPFLGMHPGVVVSGIGSLFRPAPDPPNQKLRKPSADLTTMDSRASVSDPSRTPSMMDSEVSLPSSLVQTITSPKVTSQPQDPFFDPPFPNDVRLPERKGWTNILHFINKHSDGLTSATKQYFMSHLEFGGCLADYPGLKNRYEKLRSLEDVGDRVQTSGPGYGVRNRRIRFVNYYTASTGRPKAPKSPKAPPEETRREDGALQPIEVEIADMNLSPTYTRSSSKGTYVEQHDGTITAPQNINDKVAAHPIEVQMQDLGESSGVQDDFQEPPEMRHIDSIPMEDDDIHDVMSARAVGPSEGNDEADSTPVETIEPLANITSELQLSSTEPALPPIPAEPIEPESIKLNAYTDRDSRKIAEKEQKRVMKVYQQAVKDRESAIKDRKKLVEKREKTARQEREKRSRLEERQRAKEEKEKGKQRVKEEKERENERLKEESEEEKRKATIKSEPPQVRQASAVPSVKNDKPKRDKKFCMLPPEYGGLRDKCWIRVYMEGVDEVGAHCGLFFPGPQYESLVGDVGERIGKWVEEDAAQRAASDHGHQIDMDEQ